LYAGVLTRPSYAVAVDGSWRCANCLLVVAQVQRLLGLLVEGVAFLVRYVF
jgi:hypothetical protein